VELRDWLLPMLMNGQITVKDWWTWQNDRDVRQWQRNTQTGTFSEKPLITF
jgi:hypothetical protein